ncbi:MAG: ABC transporter permease [Acidobacterium ailaaui]|nr:ABC transporter permease [Pseudacidobacterium ailaaui]
MSSVRYLFRRMLRSNGFSVIVVATIALGVGINLGTLTIIRSTLFNSIGVPQANKLVYYTLGSGNSTTPNFSIPGYEALRSEGAIKDLLAWKPTFFRVQTQSATIRPMGALVTGNTFSVFRLKPYLGRFFSEDEDVAGGKGGWVAVLGYDFWNAQMGHDPAVLGRTILIDGQAVRIVGILPQDFRGISGLAPAIVLPWHFLEVFSHPDDFKEPGNLSWYVFGRLPDGVSIENVRANLKVIGPSFRKEADPNNRVFATLFPNADADHLLGVQNGQYGITSTASGILSILITETLAVIVLLFCCCNLVLLFSGRAKREAQAFAIRAALGARISDTVRFTILEAAVFTLIGLIAAVPLAWTIARLFAILAESFIGVDVFSTVAPTRSFLMISCLSVMAIGSAIGVCVSLWQTRKLSSVSLRTGTSATSRQPNWIIGLELFAAILLITSTLVGWTGIIRLSELPSGFAISNVVLTTVAVENRDRQTEELNLVLERLRNSPGVQAAATMSIAPLSGGTAMANVRVRTKAGTLADSRIWPVSVSLQYFSAIGTKIIQGRDFTADDLSGDPVCVVSRRLAAAFGNDSLGRYLYQTESDAKNRLLTPYCRIVGVAEDAHFTSMTTDPDDLVYRLSIDAQPNIIVRASSTGLAADAVRNAIRSVDPTMMNSEVEPIKQVINRDLRVRKVITMAGVFCVCVTSVILAIGFFGVLALRVSESTREIGIQIALGARRTDICLSMLRNIRRSILIGLSSGSVVALLAAGAIARTYTLSTRLLFGGYILGVILLGLLMVIAGSIPLFRAFAVSPVKCLSSE